MADWGSLGGGLAEGLLQGSQVGRNIVGTYNEAKQMGLLEQEQKRKEAQLQQQMQLEKEKQDFENDYKKAQWGIEVSKNRNYPKETQLVGLNTIVNFFNKHISPDNPVPIYEDLPDFSTQLATKLAAIDKSNFSLEDKQRMTLDLVKEFGPEHEKYLTSRSNIYSEEIKTQQKNKEFELQKKYREAQIKKMQEDKTKESMPKVGMINQITPLVTSYFYPHIPQKTGMESLTDDMGVPIFTKVYNAATPEQRENMSLVIAKAQELAKDNPPATAVNKALEWLRDSKGLVVNPETGTMSKTQTAFGQQPKTSKTPTSGVPKPTTPAKTTTAQDKIIGMGYTLQDIEHTKKKHNIKSDEELLKMLGK